LTAFLTPSTEIPSHVASAPDGAAPRLPASVRVLLVNLNRYDQPYPVYPIGLAYLTGALHRAGHKALIWDAQFSTESLEATVASFRPELVGISMRNVDNVQQHNPVSFVQSVVDCCAQIRAVTKAILVLGGSAFSIFPRALFDLTGVDYGIQGAGEEPLIRLIERLQAGRSPTGVPGLFHRPARGQVDHQPAQFAATTFHVEPYHEPTLLKTYTSHGSLPGIQTQRGCPLRCCYCTYPLIEGKRSRFRSGEHVVAEMRRMLALGVRYTFIVDSVFNTRPDHVAEICEALIRAGLDMQWECFLRPAGITRELLQLMKRAGLRHVEFGSDSFSDPVLESYGKSFSFDDIRIASEHAHALGLHYSHFIIFGGPGETPATVEETLARAQTLPGAYYFATIGMRIYPDTPLWRSLAPEVHGESVADYLPRPRFHLAPGFTAHGLYERLAQVKKTHHNWIVGDPPPAFQTTMKKLRDRGLRGPLWEYIELLQRLDPQEAIRPAAALSKG